MDMNTQSMPHAGDSQNMAGHASLMNLVPESAVTHKAISNGSWFNPNTWADKQVPGDGANVMIARGVSVTYDDESDVQLKTVRVDGTLTFANNADTQIIVDTFVNMPSGALNIGTKANPIRADKTAAILIDGDGRIDARWDPEQLSRGIISHGEVNINGANKTEFIALAQDAEAGDRELVLDGAPRGWRVGDKLVLGGTQYNRFGNDENNSRFGDEELTITKISGNRVSFTNDDIRSGNNVDTLRFDHVRPDIPEKDRTNLYVANTTRNVTFETKDSENLPTAQRGHVMFMHNPDVEVNNAGFYNLGRSDKSKVVDDPRRNIDGSSGRGNNPRGRYGLHLHRTGADDIQGQAAEVSGNAVVGSPGWGIVHHDSYANITNNVVFDVAGAGIAAESGNEIGSWKNNLTIKTTGPGRNVKSGEARLRQEKFDLGFNGEGYWVQGAAQVAMEDNIAVSANDAGIALFGDGQGNEARDASTILIKNLPDRIQALFPEGQKEVDITDVPLNQLTGFQSYNSAVGIRVWSQLANFDGQLDLDNRTPNAAHDGRATIDNFTVWGTRTKGITTDYSSNIDFVDGLIVGDVEDPRGDGIVHNHATNGLRYVDLTVRGFGEGYNPQFPDVEKNGIVTTAIEGSVFGDNTYNLAEVGEFKPSKYALDDYPVLLEIDNTEFQVTKNNKLPVAQFSTTAAGGLSATFDAGESYDPDNVKYPGPSNGIASYGWDFNSDGKIDRFGREVTYHFNRPGNQTVSLQVLDSQGEAHTATQTVEISPTAYTNPFVDGDISNNTKLTEGRRLSSLASGEGWHATRYVRQAGGRIEMATTQNRRSGLSQVIQNDGLHQGEQTLSFRLRNTEGSRLDRKKNKVTVQLWGVDGQFDGNLTEGDGPVQAGTIPMTRNLLFQKTYGGLNGQFFDFKDFKETIDLGDGYQHLVARLETDLTDDRGDSVALDYFELGTEGVPPGELPITDSSPITDPDPDPVTPDPDPVTPDPDPVTDPDPITPDPVIPDPPDQPAPEDQGSDSANPYELPGWIAQFSFEEGRGSRTSDSSSFGNNHKGKLRGKTTWAEGIDGKGIAFPEAGVVQVKNSAGINLGTHDERTVSVWFRADQVSRKSGKQVIYEEGGGDRGLNIYLDRNRLYVGGWNQSSGESDWSGTWLETKGVSKKTWHNVSLVLDGDDELSSDAFRGYLDGKEFGVGDGSQLWKRSDGIGIGGTIGSTLFHDGQRKGGGLTGLVDEVSIFNEALSADQVATIANPSFL